jgi:hypothetical protein
MVPNNPIKRAELAKVGVRMFPTADIMVAKKATSKATTTTIIITGVIIRIMLPILPYFFADSKDMYLTLAELFERLGDKLFANPAI